METSFCSKLNQLKTKPYTNLKKLYMLKTKTKHTEKKSDSMNSQMKKTAKNICIKQDTVTCLSFENKPH